MERLPLNPNGKLDRISLPEPDISVFKAEYAAPENKIEEAICNAMEKVLECGQIGRDDDFFLLGGDSIKTIILLEKADLNLSPADIMNAKTVKNIADLSTFTNDQDTKILAAITEFQKEAKPGEQNPFIVEDTNIPKESAGITFAGIRDIPSFQEGIVAWKSADQPQGIDMNTIVQQGQDIQAMLQTYAPIN